MRCLFSKVIILTVIMNFFVPFDLLDSYNLVYNLVWWSSSRICTECCTCRISYNVIFFCIAVPLSAPDALKLLTEKDHVFLFWKSLAVREKGFNESRVSIHEKECHTLLMQIFALLRCLLPSSE